MHAQLALADLRRGRIVGEARHAEGAGGDAVAAADAGILVVGHHAGLRILLHGRDRAGRDAGRIDAVHARLLDEGEAVFLLVLLVEGAVLVDLDDVERLAGDVQRRVPVLVLGGELQRHAVGLLAGGHTGLAADAEGGIEEQPDGLGRHALVVARLCRTGRRPRGEGGAAGQRRLEEFAPVHGHSPFCRGWASSCLPRFFASMAAPPAAAPAIAASAAAAAKPDLPCCSTTFG